MRIGITDSGVGGLSVCAEVEAGLRRLPRQHDVDVMYLNAALRDDFSYNAMATRGEKLEAFSCFLRNVRKKYRPDLLFIACNTLSILFEDPYFDPLRAIPIEGIVDTGTRELTRAFEAGRDASVIVFATPTTVEEGAYARRLGRYGVPQERFVQQACPGLPDAISNDFSGAQARSLLKTFIPDALARFSSPPDKVLAFLGCTHYGYQSSLFEQLIAESVDEVRVLDPNRAAADRILDSMAAAPEGGGARFRFISPYSVPKKPQRSLAHYLGRKAPATVAALQQCIQDPELYAP